MILFTLTHILLGVDPVSADRLKAGDDENVDDSKRQCGLYYAPSSIKEAGWGVFAGKNIRENSIVGGSSPAILLFDVDRYHGNALQNTILTDYFWMADWANFSRTFSRGADYSNNPCCFSNAATRLFRKLAHYDGA